MAEASKVVTLRRDPSLTTPRSNLVSRERRRRIDIKRADNQLHPFSSQRARTRLEQRGARSQSGPPTAAVRLSSSWSDVGTPRHQAQSQEALPALQGREADGAQARWIDYNTNRPHSSLNGLTPIEFAARQPPRSMAGLTWCPRHPASWTRALTLTTHSPSCSLALPHPF